MKDCEGNMINKDYKVLKCKDNECKRQENKGWKVKVEM